MREKNWLVAEYIHKRRDVCLNDEEEEFLNWNAEEGLPQHSVFWVCPNASADEIRIPRDSSRDSYSHKEQDSCSIKICEKGLGYDGEESRERDGEFDMAVVVVSDGQWYATQLIAVMTLTQGRSRRT